MRCEANASFHDTWPRQSCNPPSRAHLALVPCNDKKLNQRTNTQPRLSDHCQSEARRGMLNCPAQPITSRMNRMWSLIRCPSGTTQMHSSWTRPTIAKVKTRTDSASVFSGLFRNSGRNYPGPWPSVFSETQSPLDWEASRTLGAAPAPCTVWLGRRNDLFNVPPYQNMDSWPRSRVFGNFCHEGVAKTHETPVQVWASCLLNRCSLPVFNDLAGRGAAASEPTPNLHLETA